MAASRRMVGSPNPKVMEMMAEEHTAAATGRRDFHHEQLRRGDVDRRSNGSLWTTPDAPPSGGWPIEKKIRRANAGEVGADLAAIRPPARSQASHEPSTLTAAMDEGSPNGAARAGEPLMTIEEAIGLRMYTGPLSSSTMACSVASTARCPFCRSR